MLLHPSRAQFVIQVHELYLARSASCWVELSKYFMFFKKILGGQSKLLLLEKPEVQTLFYFCRDGALLCCST